jgi:hypothetical protein
VGLTGSTGRTYRPHPSESMNGRLRLLLGALAAVAALVLLRILHTLSDRLATEGMSYDTFQRQGRSVGGALAGYHTERSTLAKALFTDVGFACSYAIGGALLIGSAAEALTRRNGKRNCLARILVGNAWLVLAAGMLDLGENYSLLHAYYRYGSAPGPHTPDVSQWGRCAQVLGYLKWWSLGIGAAFLIAWLAVFVFFLAVRGGVSAVECLTDWFALPGPEVSAG